MRFLPGIGGLLHFTDHNLGLSLLEREFFPRVAFRKEVLVFVEVDLELREGG